MKKTTKRSKRAKRVQRALKHAARLTPAQLSSLLADRARYSPALLAKLGGQLSQLGYALITRRELRRELRQRRAQPPSPPPAEVDLLQQAVAAVAHEAERRAHEHISLTLRLCDFPPHWADLIAPSTDPSQVARALLLAMRRVQ